MMPRPQFRLRSLFILTAIVAAWCVAGRSIGSIPDHPYLFLVVSFKLFATASMVAVVRAHDG